MNIRLYIYADRANLSEDKRHLTLDTSDGRIIVRLPADGISEETLCVYCEQPTSDGHDEHEACVDHCAAEAVQ